MNAPAILVLVGLGTLALLGSRQASAAVAPYGSLRPSPTPYRPPGDAWEPVEVYDPITGESWLEYTPALPGDFGYPEEAGAGIDYTAQLPGDFGYPEEAGTGIDYTAQLPGEFEAYPSTGELMPAPEEGAGMPTAPGDYVNPAANVAAFLTLIRTAEGTEREPNPYAITYGYGFLANTAPGSRHPADPALGGARWPGKRLPDSYCAAAGLSPGCVSTAAGAYQFIWPTWNSYSSGSDFSPASQDNAAIRLLNAIGALAVIEAGDFAYAVRLASSQWASLPYSTSGQPRITQQQALAVYLAAGGEAAATVAGGSTYTVGIQG